jgi:hypothetical protein
VTTNLRINSLQVHPSVISSADLECFTTPDIQLHKFRCSLFDLAEDGAQLNTSMRSGDTNSNRRMTALFIYRLLTLS